MGPSADHLPTSQSRCTVALLHCCPVLQLDSDDYIAAVKTIDPLLIEGLGSEYSLAALKPYIPKYRGMPHPPPKTTSPGCNGLWSAPFLSNYTGGRGKRLRLTMCNWYLPQGPGVPALYR
jgi:hypothetical protein